MIERLRVEDYDLIPQVYASSFSQPPWPKDWFSIDVFNPETVWVYKMDEKIVGFIISFVTRDYPYISVLGVASAYKRCGIGKSLLKQVLSYWSREYDRIYIHVEKSRSPALGLYKKMGFDILETDETDHYMMKEL